MVSERAVFTSIPVLTRTHVTILLGKLNFINKIQTTLLLVIRFQSNLKDNNNIDAYNQNIRADILYK